MIELTLLMSNVEFVGSFALNGIVILNVSSIENTISTKANESLPKSSSERLSLISLGSNNVCSDKILIPYQKEKVV